MKSSRIFSLVRSTMRSRIWSYKVENYFKGVMMLDYDAGILIFSPRQCCGSGSGIRCLLDPWIRDPEWVFSGSRISDPGSKDHILKSFDNFFGLWLHEKVWQSFLQIFCATQIRIINYLHGSCSDPIINNFWKSFWFLQVCDLLILSLKTDVNSVADPGCFPGSGVRIRLFLSRIRIFSIPDERACLLEVQ